MLKKCNAFFVSALYLYCKSCIGFRKPLQDLQDFNVFCVKLTDRILGILYFTEKVLK